MGEGREEKGSHSQWRKKVFILTTPMSTPSSSSSSSSSCVRERSSIRDRRCPFLRRAVHGASSRLEPPELQTEVHSRTRKSAPPLAAAAASLLRFYSFSSSLPFPSCSSSFVRSICLSFFTVCSTVASLYIP